VWNNKIARTLAAVSATALIVGGAAIAASAANAITDGTGTITGGTSTTAPLTLNTNGTCSDPTADHLIVKISGTGFPAGGANVVGNSKTSLYTSGSNYQIPISNTLQVIGNAQSPAVVYTGTYTFDVICGTALGGVDLGDFFATITFSNPTTFTANPATPIATGTTLALGTASPVAFGTSETLTATVTGGVSGSVQFMDGASPLGGAVSVNGSGMAAYTTSALNAGTHSLTAVFTGFNPSSVTGSTSSAQSLVVTQTTSSTALSFTPASGADSNTSLGLKATITPTAATGTVQFADGATNIGAPVPVVGGVASTSGLFAAATHTFHAVFTPTDTTNVAGSSDVQTYVVSAYAGVTAGDTIQTEVPAGGLAISVATPGAQDLGPMALNGTSNLLNVTGTLLNVTVTDTRAGTHAGWTASGIVSDFAGPTAFSIAGANLGWTPNVVSHSLNQTVTAGPLVAPALGVYTASETGGLHSTQTLASSAASPNSNGTAVLNAALNLNAPTDTPAGTYVATLTLTAI
jgi:Bacterial Ig-like domain (group 3)